MNDQESRLEKIGDLLNNPEEARFYSSHIDCFTESTSDPSDERTKKRTSGHNYPPELVEIIKEHSNEWVLDCGSGEREREFPHIVNFEIQPYAGVDVVGSAEELPFKDESFSVVISLSVLEHVRNPFKVANEIERVLKPDGTLWLDTAFMQPYHGYPSHYYNMTHQGLANLFSENIHIRRDKVPRYGTPIWSLHWFISKYANSLPEPEREEFLNTPISELLQSPELLSQKSYSKKLPEDARREMAATVSILAKKARFPQVV